MLIHKEIAQAIQLFLDDCTSYKFSVEKSKSVLVAEHYGQDWNKYEDGQYSELNNITTYNLMKCLVNGYEIKE